MKLTFWGAAQQVTGSMFLLEIPELDYKILIDCGLDMENAPEDRPKSLYKGAHFPFDASMINVVLLTHAHLDHSGHIPNLFRDNYEGQVLCTNATMELANILLRDSAKLNARRLFKFHRSRKRGYGLDKKLNFNPHDLYVEKDVQKAMERFVPIGFGKEFKLTNDISISFIPTGHLLGAGNVLINVKGKKVLFSGDIGRRNYPLLPDPSTPPEVDYLICETTYGSREHQSVDATEEELEQVIRETCIDSPGRLIIPAFSIGRTQAVLYTMNKISKQKGLPPIKIYSDSPMAYSSNQVYERSISNLNQEAQLFKADHGTLFDFENLVFIDDSKASRAISDHSESCIIISSSGMMEGGRIQHHIQNNIQNPYCTIFIVGYCAEGTLGRKLLDGQKTLKMGKNEVQVSAKIQHTDAFSGHGDVHDLLRFIHAQSAEKVKKIFLVHGEKNSMNDFKEKLAEEGFPQVEMPTVGQSFELV